ncbi:hypothetical protein ACLB2K_010411 [Fragaria x ananassa]
MALQSSHKRIKAPNMSIPVLEKDKKQEANPLKELKETLRRLQNQKHELQKKILANILKAQQMVAAADSKKAQKLYGSIERNYDQYVLKKYTEKKGRLQKKIDKLMNFSFCIENQITLLEGQANTEKTPVYDGSPKNEEPAVKSQYMDMTMNNDELREMLDEINKAIDYMPLKSSAKLGKRCQHILNKPFVSMKNNLCKLFRSVRSTSEGRPGPSQITNGDRGPSLATTQPK